uniref:Uncharacterized protein n=1 Tax=Arundo donax TaxID=35708 RepID=A0A0A8XZW6_ARUDO
MVTQNARNIEAHQTTVHTHTHKDRAPSAGEEGRPRHPSSPYYPQHYILACTTVIKHATTYLELAQTRTLAATSPSTSQGRGSMSSLSAGAAGAALAPVVLSSGDGTGLKPTLGVHAHRNQSSQQQSQWPAQRFTCIMWMVNR